MSTFFSAAREARTTIDCPTCSNKLDIKRTCHEAYMSCRGCEERFELSPFIPQMDEVMESFLERLFVDRV